LNLRRKPRLACEEPKLAAEVIDDGVSGVGGQVFVRQKNELSSWYVANSVYSPQPLLVLVVRKARHARTAGENRMH